jgi:heterotetrameric sarcosine oxidase delta subunit
MSFMLVCPNCGPREVYEFRYGGQVVPSVTSKPTEPCAASSTARNLPGPQRELWYHRLGCRRWLTAERDVRTNTVVRTGWLAEGDAP